MYGGTATDEDLFRLRGDSRLLISLRPGSSELVKWKPRSCSDGDESSCWLYYGDLFGPGRLLPGRVPSLSDPRFDRERVNVTFRWIRRQVPQCCLLGLGARELPALVLKELTRFHQRGFGMAYVDSFGVSVGPVGARCCGISGIGRKPQPISELEQS